jgi:asparagine synthase (glutamine-hydrolysing)
VCRICGIVDPSVSIESLKNSVTEMCKSLAHGGPDGEGIFTSEKHHLVIGHRRLALIDLSEAGHQPMGYDNGRLQISFNGEIYNYQEIRKTLEGLHHNFKSHTDTEVILAAYSQWGTAAFPMFNGMYAFALWDETKQCLHLVRGPAGIKPLYYYMKGRKLIFGSEVRAFKKVENFQKDSDSAIYLLAYGHIPEPFTTLKDVRMLPKGGILTYYPSTGKHEFETFGSFTFSEEIVDYTEAKEQLRSALQAAVRRHMISDASIGVFLSGGLDSSIVAVLASQRNHELLKTLSIIFNEKDYSEKAYQDILIGKLPCKHQHFLVDEEEFSAALPASLNDMDLPSVDGLNTWVMCRYAKQLGIKAVLSGIGGDELFGGYPSFERMEWLSVLKLVPNFMLLKGKYTALKKLRRLSYLTIGGAKGMYLFLRGQYIPFEIAKLIGCGEKEVWDTLSNQPQLPDISHLSLQNQASWMEINLYMQNQLLRDSDVMSMAHGVELRVPFLDKDFFELALKLSSGLKYKGRLKKQLLIDTFSDVVPRPIWDRSKMGFSFPFNEWMKMNSFVKAELGASKKLDQYYSMFIKDELHWSQLMTLLVMKHEGYD